jgi:hypothetical protein
VVQAEIRISCYSISDTELAMILSGLLESGQYKIITMIPFEIYLNRRSQWANVFVRLTHDPSVRGIAWYTGEVQNGWRVGDKGTWVTPDRKAILLAWCWLQSIPDRNISDPRLCRDRFLGALCLLSMASRGSLPLQSGWSVMLTLKVLLRQERMKIYFHPKECW